MNWILLAIAGLCEVAFASCLGKVREATGSAVYLWYLGFFITMSLSMLLLMKVTQTMPIGTAYAVWTGIGAVGTTFWRLFFLSTLVISLIGLKLVAE